MEMITGSTLKEILRKADEGKYAVPMFNYTDIWDQMAVLEAAQELHAPVMFASIPKTVEEIGIEVLGEIGKIRMRESCVPVIHHLDHSKSTELCRKAVDCGYPSVMIDASAYDFETNISMTGEVVDYAHKKGVCVEAEIGRIKGRDYEASFEGDDFLARAEDAEELVQRTGVDTLAVGIGTAHGFYEGKPELNFRRLAEINEAVDIPLVLHGGTGIPEEDVKRAIRNGINKVNIGTQIRYTYMKSVADEVERVGAAIHTIDIMKEVRKQIKETAKTWIRICMADGKA